MHIPLVPLASADPAQLLARHSRAFARLGTLFDAVALRAPPATDAGRWHAHAIGARRWQFAQPLTFTPYAAVQPCSARCRFCSENLRDDAAGAVVASLQRPGARWFEDLRRALAALDGVPLAYSLSGLESTDDPDWLLALLRTLRGPAPGPRIEGAVLYTNGAGLVDDGARLVPALAEFGLSWIEWSRHHDRADTNQALMRFRAGRRIAQQAAFEQALAQAAARLPVKLVCIVQRGGIESAADVLRYADQAAALGASTVIFREFSALPAHYRQNATRRHIDAARIPVDELLLQCLDEPRFRARHAPFALTEGYYFWNARWRRDDGLELVFERSDYGAMLEREASGRVYKLVFHANSRLCAGWQPDRHVLWSPDADA